MENDEKSSKTRRFEQNLLHVGSSKRPKCAEEVGGLPILPPLRALARHAIVHGKVFCRYSGKYKCGCRRCWHGIALKIQNIAPSDPGALSDEYFHDCRICTENDAVLHIGELELGQRVIAPFVSALQGGPSLRHGLMRVGVQPEASLP
jgi:hypothetical protein